MTEKQKTFIIRRWNRYSKTTKLRMAAEFFSIMRSDEPQRDWWRFLYKKIATLDRKCHYSNHIRNTFGSLNSASYPYDDKK